MDKNFKMTITNKHMEDFKDKWIKWVERRKMSGKTKSTTILVMTIAKY